MIDWQVFDKFKAVDQRLWRLGVAYLENGPYFLRHLHVVVVFAYLFSLLLGLIFEWYTI